MAHRKLEEAKQFKETLEARMPRAQLASYRMQRALGLHNDTNPFPPLPDAASVALPAGGSSPSPCLIRHSAVSNDGQMSNPIQLSGDPSQDADTDEESIDSLEYLLTSPHEIQGPDIEKENISPVRRLLPSPEDIDIPITSEGASPPYLPSVASTTKHIPIAEGFYDRLKTLARSGSANKIELVSLSFYDLAPEEDANTDENGLLLHVEGRKGRSLAVCRASIGGGIWIYFIVQPEGQELTVFGCPIEAVMELGEEKEMVVRNGVSHEYIRVELDMCRGGVPLFDGASINPVGPAPWLDIVKCMGRSNCRVRYLHEQKNPQQKRVIPIR